RVMDGGGRVRSVFAARPAELAESVGSRRGDDHVRTPERQSRLERLPPGRPRAETDDRVAGPHRATGRLGRGPRPPAHRPPARGGGPVVRWKTGPPFSRSSRRRPRASRAGWTVAASAISTPL